jgi:hypothetical protein
MGFVAPLSQNNAFDSNISAVRTTHDQTGAPPVFRHSWVRDR